MKTEPNFEKGTRYFWVHKATLACDFIGLRTKVITLHTKRPKPRNQFHRVELTVVRTAREANALAAKFAKRRERVFAKFQRTISKHTT